jgi:hypothetical protein
MMQFFYHKLFAIEINLPGSTPGDGLPTWFCALGGAKLTARQGLDCLAIFGPFEPLKSNHWTRISRSDSDSATYRKNSIILASVA